MFSTIKYSFKSMMRKKARSLLTMTGITIGVMSVIIISGISNTGKSMINGELESIGVDGLSVSTHVGNVSCNLKQEDLEKIRSNEYVDKATPLTVYTARTKFCGVESDCMAWGISDDVQSIIKLKLLHGRMIDSGDIASGDKVCLVDEEFAKANYLRTNIVGKSINIMLNGSYEKYKVVGVVSTGGSILKNFISDLMSSFVYLPYTTMESSLGVKGFTRIAVKLNQSANSAKASQEIETAVKTDKAYGTDVKVEDMTAQKDKLNGIMNIISVVLAVIAGISLIVSGLSIMTVMLVSVSERTREIGIKKAIGASKPAILFEFLSESFLISLVGGIFGAALGVAVVLAGCAFAGVSAIINIKTIIICMLFAMGVGVLFGVYPAVKAANMKPAHAIRTE